MISLLPFIFLSIGSRSDNNSKSQIFTDWLTNFGKLSLQLYKSNFIARNIQVFAINLQFVWYHSFLLFSFPLLGQDLITIPSPWFLQAGFDCASMVTNLGNGNHSLELQNSSFIVRKIANILQKQSVGDQYIVA